MTELQWIIPVAGAVICLALAVFWEPITKKIRSLRSQGFRPLAKS